MRSYLIDLALQKPSSLGEPYALWTLERLQRAFQARYGLHLSDSTIWTWLDAEGCSGNGNRAGSMKSSNTTPQFADKREHRPGLSEATTVHTRHLCR